MDRAYDDVRFLARSTNRAAVLAGVRDGPVTRDELLAGVDASRVTLRRILGELTDRGWVERGPEGFEATTRGTVVAAEFERLVDAMRATHRLEGVLEWLPTDALEFDLGRLADAEVTRPDVSGAIAPVARVDELIREADEATVVSAGISASTVAANRDAVVEGGQRFEGVIPEAARRIVEESPEVAAAMREMLASGRAELSVTEEPVPEMMMAILDERVVFGLLGDGLPRGVVETEDEAVRGWARTFFERHRAAAEPLTADAFE